MDASLESLRCCHTGPSPDRDARFQKPAKNTTSNRAKNRYQSQRRPFLKDFKSHPLARVGFFFPRAESPQVRARPADNDSERGGFGPADLRAKKSSHFREETPVLSRAVDLRPATRADPLDNICSQVANGTR